MNESKKSCRLVTSEFTSREFSTDERDLLGLLTKYSYKEGTFTLASGKQSDFYIDCKQTFLRSDGLRLAAMCMLFIHDFRVSEIFAHIAGEGVGGIPLAVAVASRSMKVHETPICPVIVRGFTKDHGTIKRVERSRECVPNGSRVVLVEDVLTTGGSALRAVEALRADGLEVPAVIALVNRREGAEKLLLDNGVPRVFSLFNRDDFVKK